MSKLVSIPYELIDESCKLTNENGCMFESNLEVIYRGKKHKISDRNFGTNTKCYLRDHDGYPVDISECLIEESQIKKIKRIHNYWKKVFEKR
jgi:hypothetical protein